MPGGWCRWPVMAGGCRLSVSEGEGGARGAEHTRMGAAGAWMAVPGTGSRRQAGRAGWKKEGGRGGAGVIRTAGTAAGAWHTRGPGGVGPMREIISKGFTHVLSISPYHLPYPAVLPCRPAGYSLGYASPYPLPPPSVCAHRDSAVHLCSVEFRSQYGKSVGFCVFVGGGGYRYLAGDGAGIFFLFGYVFGAVWWCFRVVFRCVFGAYCRRFPRCVSCGVRMAGVAVYVCNDISQLFFGVSVVVAAVV